jgi:hypothetical protein
MASDTDASLVGLIEVLNSAILVSILELSKHPALHDSHKLRLRQESQRLRIWGNELGIAQGGLEVRLRGEQELEYSLALAHIMVGNGLVTVGMFSGLPEFQRLMCFRTVSSASRKKIRGGESGRP